MNTRLDAKAALDKVIRKGRIHFYKSIQIAEGVAVNDIVIVCKTAEAKVIQSLLSQVGLGIRGVITQKNLEEWYHLCQIKYQQQMGKLCYLT